MIEHKLSDLTDKNVYTETISIWKSQYERARRLLDIKESFDQYSEKELEKMGVIRDEVTHLFFVDFNDGASLRWNLCSGQNNYYDDVTFTHANGIEEPLDCVFDLEDIEIDTGSNIYRVILDVKEDPDVRMLDERFWEPDEILWNILFQHRGHNVEIVTYGGDADPADVCLECLDCNQVILDGEVYTICSREDGKDEN